MDRKAILGNTSSFGSRYVADYEELKGLVEHYKGAGLRVVLVSGSFDMIHIGHMRYLERAKEQGDILVVGVESDEKIRKRKNRPVAVGEAERLEVLAHNRNVDILTLKGADDEQWRLIKAIRPDVLVAVANEHAGHPGPLTPENYTDEELHELKEWCGEVVLVERQAPVSTTGRIRQMMIEGAVELKSKVSDAIDKVFTSYTGGEESEEPS